MLRRYEGSISGLPEGAAGYMNQRFFSVAAICRPLLLVADYRHKCL